MEAWLLLDADGYTRWCARTEAGFVVARSRRGWATPGAAVRHLRTALGVGGYSLHKSR